MKTNNSYFIAFTAALAAVTSSYAAVAVDGTPTNPDIVVSADGSTLYGYNGDLDTTGTRSFTMTAGLVQVSTTGNGAAYAISSDGDGGAAVNISGGTINVSESGNRNAELFQSRDDDDVWTISGGTFTATESGGGALYGFYSIRNTEVNVSGGTWNFSQDDSSVGAIFGTDENFRAGANINLSGGQFNNLDQFDTHIALGHENATFNISGLSLIDTGLNYIGNAIQDLNGTVTGTLEDGSAFSFNFAQAAAGQITASVIPEPSIFALLAGLTGLTFVMVRRRCD